jgi:Flp pilus assembly protein TadG
MQVRRTGDWNIGSAAVEFAITAPFLVLLALGIADYGAMVAQSSSLAAYARAGAEYAHAQLALGNGFPSAGSIETALNMPAGTLLSTTTPAPPCNVGTDCTTQPYCTCVDGSTATGMLPTCPGLGDANPCAAKTDQRVLGYVSVTATINPYQPLVAYAGFAPFPSSLSSTTVIRFR